jgi:hypothetical protein
MNRTIRTVNDIQNDINACAAARAAAFAAGEWDRVDLLSLHLDALRDELAARR